MKRSNRKRDRIEWWNLLDFPRPIVWTVALAVERHHAVGVQLLFSARLFKLRSVLAEAGSCILFGWSNKNCGSEKHGGKKVKQTEWINILVASKLCCPSSVPLCCSCPLQSVSAAVRLPSAATDFKRRESECPRDVGGGGGGVGESGWGFRQFWACRGLSARQGHCVDDLL